MPKFAANLTMMFTEHAFLDRFAAAADAGFAAVEFLFPYDHAPEAIAERLASNNLTQALFNMPPGDWALGERGFAALPDRFEDLRTSVAKALVYADATGCKRLHMMAGIADGADLKGWESYRRAVTYAAEALAVADRALLLEPINPRGVPGYFLNDFNKTAALIAELALPNVKLQYDIFHRQILHGDVTVSLRELLPMIGHIQIASVPSRNEPDGEELNFPYLFAQLDRLGYDGYVGCEYNPRGNTKDGLDWFKPWKRT
jgi:hydroxypyruvate isomerase